MVKKAHDEKEITLTAKCLECGGIKIGRQWHYGIKPKIDEDYIEDYCPHCLDVLRGQTSAIKRYYDTRAFNKGEKEGIEKLMGAL